MARRARGKSESGIYHIIMRGINKDHIFYDSEDKKRFYEILLRYKKLSDYLIYGYCFMDNHVHILLKEISEPLSLVVKRISGSYVYWYNNKHGRCGHLFQERYRSETVEDDIYFLTVLRYIHQNPLKAGLVKNVLDYNWTSLSEYLHEPILVDREFALNIFSPNCNQGIKLLKTFMEKQNSDFCLDIDDKKKLTDQNVRALLEEYNNSNLAELSKINKNDRDFILTELKAVEGLTIRQLSRITGISKSYIARL